MFEPILADYTPDGDDWTVEVTAAGQTLTATAPGLIAARDHADRLAERIAPGDQHRTVVHTLEGDAVGFTEAYLNARLGRTDRPLADRAAGSGADARAEQAPAEPAAPASA